MMPQNNRVAHPVFTTKLGSANAVKISHLNIRFQGVFGHSVGTEWGTRGRVEGDYRNHVHFSCEGHATLIYRGANLELEPGNAYWIPGNTPLVRECAHYYRHYSLVLSCELMNGVDLLSTWPERRPLLLGKWVEQEWVADWTERPFSLNTHMRLQGQLYKWIAEHFDGLETMISAYSQRHVRYSRVFDLIENRLGGDLQIGEMARAHGTSLRAFSLAFTRDIGLSPKAYLNNRLNQYACRLLITEDWPVKAIAQKLRFADERYFSRFFSKMNGVPPHKYRRMFLTHEIRTNGD